MIKGRTSVRSSMSGATKSWRKHARVPDRGRLHTAARGPRPAPPATPARPRPPPRGTTPPRLRHDRTPFGSRGDKWTIVKFLDRLQFATRKETRDAAIVLDLPNSRMASRFTSPRRFRRRRVLTFQKWSVSGWHQYCDRPLMLHFDRTKQYLNLILISIEP